MAKFKKQREDNSLRQPSEQDERHLQKEISPLDGQVSPQSYGLKVATILNAADKLTADLEYLCSLIEQPDPEFPIEDAIVYATAITALSTHIDFVVEDLSLNELSADQSYVKLSKDEVMMLSNYSRHTDEAIQQLEEICGISLQNN